MKFNRYTTLKVVACPHCHAAVYSLQHARTGHQALVDVEPTLYGNLMIDEVARTYRILDHEGLLAVRMAFHHDGQTPPLHTNHVSTCPVLTRRYGAGQKMEVAG